MAVSASGGSRSVRLFLAGALLSAAAFGRDLRSFDRSLNVSGPVDLEIENGSGGVTVRSGNANTVRVHAIIRGSDWDFSPEMEQRAREVQANPPIQQSGNSVRIERVGDDYVSRRLSVSYEIETPARTRLHSHTGSGGQTVEGIQGPLNVTTGSGGLHITRIDDEVIARTGSGGIDLDSIKGRVEASTGSGGIRGTDLKGPITARTGSGGVRLRLDPGAGYDLHAQAGSGRVFVDPPITMQNTSFGRHEVRGKIRGGGAAVEVTTGSGGVTIE